MFFYNNYYYQPKILEPQWEENGEGNTYIVACKSGKGRERIGFRLAKSLAEETWYEKTCGCSQGREARRDLMTRSVSGKSSLRIQNEPVGTANSMLFLRIYTIK